ncbi:MAG: BTAD domain-containing putative transcriptional regulator [Dermatophilaceae bacterium]
MGYRLVNDHSPPSPDSAITSGVGSPGLLVEVLGSLRAFVGGREIDLGPPKQRAVFALLAMRRASVVPRDEIVDLVWSEEPPLTARGSVHTYVSGLRRALGTERVALVGTSAGYSLAVADEALDEAVLQDLVARSVNARATADVRSALAHIDEALALWRSRDALLDVPGRFAAEQRVRLAGLRRRLLIDRTELITDDPALSPEVAAAADRLALEVDGAPYDERLRVTLMHALHRSGRVGDALTQYDSLRVVLAEDLGVDPSAETRAAHAALLTDRSPRAQRPPPQPSSDNLPVAPERAVRVVPAQLPPDDGVFVGRDADLAEMSRTTATGRSRLVAIVGIGGVGKTTLAVRFGHCARERFPDGQIHLDLRGFDARRPPMTPAAALGQLLSALGVTSAPAEYERRLALWRTLTADRRMLVILDNASSASQVDDLLPGAPACQVVVTSRDRLAGLVVRRGARRITLGALSDEDSMRLLAAAVGADDVAAAGATAGRLVRLCGSLPFALRIAAEQVGSGGPQAIGELVLRLENARHRLDALDLGEDDLGSVRGVLQCSVERLDRDTAFVFRLLGAMPVANCTQQMLTSILDTSLDRAAVVSTRLVAGHLLTATGDRYAMHDLTKAYAAEVAVAVPEENRQSALGRLLDWYIATLTKGTNLSLPFDPPQVRWPLPVLADESDLLRWSIAELPNLVASVAAAHVRGHHEAASQLAALMFHAFYATGDAVEWLDVLRIARRSATRLRHDHALAVLLNHTSVALSRLGRNDLAVERLHEALALSGGEQWSYRVSLLGNLASTLREAKDFDAARAPALEGLQLAEQLGMDYYISGLNDVLCELHTELGEWESAMDRGRRGLDTARQVGSKLLESNLLINLGLASNGLDDDTAADDYFHQALRLCASTGDRYHEALALFGLARIREAKEDAEARREARDLAGQALTRFEQLGSEEVMVVREFCHHLLDV